MKDKIIKVKRACNIRDYVYTARINARTGKLLGIDAGCRRWIDFDEARLHYARDRWSERKIIEDYAHNVESSNTIKAHRTEARCLLNKLLEDVIKKQNALANRRRKNKEQS